MVLIPILLAVVFGPVEQGASKINAESPGDTVTTQVTVKLRTGGSVTGLLVDHTSQGLVLVRDRTPFVFSWNDLKPESACHVRRELLIWERGGADRLTAADQFELGTLALRVERTTFAANAFAAAKKLDPSLQSKVQDALAKHRAARRATNGNTGSFDGNGDENNGLPSHTLGSDEDPNDSDEPVSEDLPGNDNGKSAAATFELVGLPGPDTPESQEELRRQVMDVYRTFGAKVQEVLGKDVALVETDHYLIWTDWPAAEQDRLAGWCEAMYAALCRQFEIDPKAPVFLAKCPVFCWKDKTRFRRFAREFDGYGATDAIGYTRSIAKTGHTHVVVLSQGHSEIDLNRFASTLVHEGTHAFLHRLYTTNLIPHWVNEGLADMTAERVLGDRCDNAERAAMLAWAYVRYDWPIDDLLTITGPIGVEAYPLAHSVVKYMNHLGSEKFAAFVKALKEGETVPQALQGHFGIPSNADLERQWREWVRTSDPAPRVNDTNGTARSGIPPIEARSSNGS